MIKIIDGTNYGIYDGLMRCFVDDTNRVIMPPTSMRFFSYYNRTGVDSCVYIRIIPVLRDSRLNMRESIRLEEIVE
jgi:hypothetical protein